MSGIICTSLDFSATSFQNSWKKLEPQIQAEARKSLGLLIMAEPGKLPSKLHFHKYSGRDGVYCIHVTADDRYKASFTIDGPVLRLRFIKDHDTLDKNP